MTAQTTHPDTLTSWFRVISHTVLALLVVMAVGGCAGYRDGGSRTVGEFTDDVGIQAMVKTALIRNPDTNGLRINVEVKRGIVSLYGRVPSEQARATAVEVTSGIAGVVAVEDYLRLPSGS